MEEQEEWRKKIVNNSKHYYIDEEKDEIVWIPVKGSPIRTDGLTNDQMLEWWEGLKTLCNR